MNSSVVEGEKRNATFPAPDQVYRQRGVVNLLREDAQHFASVSTREQAALMQGTTTAALAGDEAMRAGSDEDREWQRRERERAIREYEAVWGRLPPEFQ